MNTAWKLSKYGVISDPHFPVFSPNTGKHGPEITPSLDTFHAVEVVLTVTVLLIKVIAKRIVCMVCFMLEYLFFLVLESLYPERLKLIWK